MTTRSKEANVDVAEKKEMIGTLAKFQVALEKIDSYHHVVLPPLYRQVGCFATHLIQPHLILTPGCKVCSLHVFHCGDHLGAGAD